MWNLYDRLFPLEDDNDNQRRWRRNIGLAVFLLIGFSLLVGAALIYNLPLIGQISWAKAVNAKIETVIAPLTERLEVVELTVQKQASTTNQLLARVAEDQLDYLVIRRCKSRDFEERTYLSREIAKYEDEYLEHKNRPYRPIQCEDIQYRNK